MRRFMVFTAMSLALTACAHSPMDRRLHIDPALAVHNIEGNCLDYATFKIIAFASIPNSVIQHRGPCSYGLNAQLKSEWLPPDWSSVTFGGVYDVNLYYFYRQSRDAPGRVFSLSRRCSKSEILRQHENGANINGLIRVDRETEKITAGIFYVNIDLDTEEVFSLVNLYIKISEPGSFKNMECE